MKIVVLIKWITLKKFLNAVLPYFALIFIIYSMASIIITFYAKINLNLIEFPDWVLTVSLIFEIILTFIGIFGYYSTLINNYEYIKIYLCIDAVISFILLAGGIVEIVFYFALNSFVNEHWKDIDAKNDPFRSKIRKNSI